ncbi:hypothetical protein ACJRO7_020191 [Eucalyptus globulus]|uniref:Uncharacterized protein n=1 Tax=Eucalyptus globulus TaxID=34317 RepID=A0ABD3KHZ3_EUCGL
MPPIALAPPLRTWSSSPVCQIIAQGPPREHEHHLPAAAAQELSEPAGCCSAPRDLIWIADFFTLTTVCSSIVRTPSLSISERPQKSPEVHQAGLLGKFERQDPEARVVDGVVPFPADRPQLEKGCCW